MSNPSQAQTSTGASNKKRKPSIDWKRILIVGVLAIAIIAMVAPGLVQWVGNFSASSNDYPPPSSNSANTTTPPPAPTEAPVDPADVPEPKFQKEGELYFQSTASGKAIAKIDIEKAETDIERQMGLMFRKSMPEEQGMLFLFEQSEMQGFWMRNTYIPLDIMFVDENGVINTIHENAKPLNDNSLPSKAKSKYVVEVNGGYAKRHGIKEGDKISWQ